MKKIKIKNFKAFTLVELIIVITILAILATIAFVSFQNYTKGARDANRLANISNISKGLELFQIQTGKFPMVDDKIGTGTINGDAVVHVGYIGDTISRLIKLDRTPTDQATMTRYIYGINISKTKYQVATVAEDLQVNRNTIVTQTYADGGLKARVQGNYNGLLAYSGMLYNTPSLIITFSGSTSQDLLATTTNYVIDKAENLPYLAGGAKKLNSLTPSQILQKLTNTGGILAVTGVTIPTDATTWNSSSGSLQTKLGYSIDIIGQAVFLDRYFTDIKGTLSDSGVSGGGGEITLANCAAQGQILTASTSQSGCNRNDFIICNGVGTGVVLAACNVGTNVSGTGVASYGNYFQWGRNKGFPGSDITVTTTRIQSGTLTNLSVDNGLFVSYSNAPSFGWSIEDITNNWGVITGTYSSRKGPCDIGYHIPNSSEWTKIKTAGMWANNSGALMADTLLLPQAGYRFGSSYNYASKQIWYYTTQTVGDFFLIDGSNNINISGGGMLASAGLPIRCMKD